MSIADKIRAVLSIKSAIKAAIAGKGVAIDDVTPFSDYPAKIQSIVAADASKVMVDYLIDANGIYLTKIIFPAATVQIQASAFISQSYLKQVVLNEGITAISYNVFQYCSNLESINFPSTLKTIGSSALAGTKIKTLTLEYNITALGSAAFQGCSSLEQAILNANIASIPSSLFINCTKLISVTLGSNIKQIASYAFSGCTSLVNINLENITTLEGNSFNNCSALQSVNLPALTSLLSNNFFVNVNSLEFIDFGKLATFMVGTIQNAPKLKSLIFREESVTFQNSSFTGMTGLKYIEFNRVAQIFILSSAFQNLSVLEAIVIRCPTPTSLNNGSLAPFSGMPSTCKIYVPDASLNAYKTANGWLNLAAYFMPMSEFVMPVL